MRRLLLLFVGLCLLPAGLDAQFLFPQARRGSAPAISWEYDAYVSYDFDNREFDGCGRVDLLSETLHALVFSPSVGLSLPQGKHVRHRVMVGFNAEHDMGTGAADKDVFTGFTANYDAHVRLGNGALFEGICGIIPRHWMEGEYSEAFFSDSLAFFDSDLEGVLLKYRSNKLQAEMGLDWMGKYGDGRRERFQIFTSGLYAPKDWLSLGWTGSFYHYACSPQAGNVVDNHLLQPYLRLDAAPFLRLDELSLQAGALLSYQCERDKDLGSPKLPLGGEFVLRLRRKGLGLENATYVGDDLMPYHDQTDPAGIRYADQLYRGSPLYRGFYDRAELFWEPQLSEFLSLRVSARFHFGEEGFLGSQQKIGFCFNLDAYRHPGSGSGRIGQPAQKRRNSGFRLFM